MCIGLGGASSISMISTLKCGKLPQAINSVRRILPLMPVGKASGILSGTMFRGTVCVCRCVHVFVFMQLHARRYQSLRSFAGRTHMARKSATFLFWVKMLHLRHESLMMSGRAQTIHTLWAESQIKEHIFLTVEFRNTCSGNAENRGNDWFIFNC